MGQNDSATAFSNRTSALPTAQQAAHCVNRDIRRVSQLFIGYAELNPSRDSLANAVRISQEDIGKPIPRVLENQCLVGGNIPGEIIAGGLERIEHELREPQCKTANGWAVPNERSTVLYRFRANKIREGWGHQGRSAEDMARSNPYQDELSVAGRIEEKAHSTVLQQEELVGEFALVRYDGFFGKTAMFCCF